MYANTGRRDSDTPKNCAIDSCSRLSRGICHCCGRNICLFHLNEHNDLLNQQLTPLLEMIDAFNQRLQTINIQQTAIDYRQQLDQWRTESHKKIDLFYAQKCQELDRLLSEKINEQQEELLELQTDINELMRTQETTRADIDEFTHALDHLKRELKHLEERFLRIEIRPLILDTHLISIRGLNEPNYNLNHLSTVYKTINVPRGSYAVLASNDRSLLIHQIPNLCLIDRDLSIHKQIPWRHGMIYDMCWSWTLNQYLILNEKDLYLLDESTMSISNVRTIEKHKWFSCACSDCFLYLSTNQWASSVTKIGLLPPKPFSQQWESPSICQKDEYIDSMAYQEKILAMVIRNRTTQTMRIDLTSAESLKLICTLQLSIPWNPEQPFHCSAFIDGDWLVTDYYSGRLLHVTSEGKLKSTLPYNTIPQSASLFGSNRLAVATKDGINFHSLNYRKTFTLSVV